MKAFTIELEEATARELEKLPNQARQLLTSKAIEHLLQGTLYPTGSEQLELAIDLAEAGVAEQTIEKLTRLHADAFLAFLQKK